MLYEVVVWRHVEVCKDLACQVPDGKPLPGALKRLLDGGSSSQELRGKTNLTFFVGAVRRIFYKKRRNSKKISVISHEI